MTRRLPRRGSLLALYRRPVGPVPVRPGESAARRSAEIIAFPKTAEND